MKENRFIIQPDKSEFLKSEVTYPGHVITDTGIQPNPEKIKAIKNLKPPKDVKEVQQSLGLLTYYRKFVPNFSELSKPLSQLLKKDTKFNWTLECQENFEKLIKILTSDLLLQYPNFEAIGSVLQQKK